MSPARAHGEHRERDTRGHYEDPRSAAARLEGIETLRIEHCIDERCPKAAKAPAAKVTKVTEISQAAPGIQAWFVLSGKVASAKDGLGDRLSQYPDRGVTNFQCPSPEGQNPYSSGHTHDPIGYRVDKRKAVHDHGS